MKLSSVRLLLHPTFLWIVTQYKRRLMSVWSACAHLQSCVREMLMVQSTKMMFQYNDSWMSFFLFTGFISGNWQLVHVRAGTCYNHTSQLSCPGRVLSRMWHQPWDRHIHRPHPLCRKERWHTTPSWPTVQSCTRHGQKNSIRLRVRDDVSFGPLSTSTVTTSEHRHVHCAALHCK